MALHAAVDGCNSTVQIESHVNCINHLLVAGAQLNSEKKNKTILMVAANKGFLELVSEILIKEAWVNHMDNDGKTALHYAIDTKVENYDVVNILIKYDANMNIQTSSEGITPLMFAVNRGHQMIAKTLIANGCNLITHEFNNQNTALHLACQKGEKEIVEFIANEHTFNDVFNIKNKLGQTPLDISQDKVMEMQAKKMSGPSQK